MTKPNNKHLSVITEWLIWNKLCAYEFKKKTKNLCGKNPLPHAGLNFQVHWI